MNLFRDVVNSRWLNYFLLGTLFWLVAAASFSGFIGKWGLRDKDDRFSIEMMLEGTAHKPFVYRQLVPLIANTADSLVSEPLKDFVVNKANPSKIFKKTTAVNSNEIGFQYIVVYFTTFFSLFLSLFILRALSLKLGAGQLEAILGPTVTILSIPYFQTVGGYFYDSTEIMFLGLTLLMAIRGNFLVLLSLVIPATINKEAFLFFIPSLFPILKINYGGRTAAALILTLMLISGSTYLFIKHIFFENSGGGIEFHLIENLSNYLKITTYLQHEITYGIPGPEGMSFVSLIIIFIISYKGWPSCPNIVKEHILVVAVINLILFMVFAATGELRNLSLMIVGFSILTTFAIAQFK